MWDYNEKGVCRYGMTVTGDGRAEGAEVRLMRSGLHH